MDQYVQVSLILGHIYPQYEFKVIFQVAYPPSDPHGGVTKGGFFFAFLTLQDLPFKISNFYFWPF